MKFYFEKVYKVIILRVFKLKKAITKILQSEGTPYPIALGVAIGVFWNFIPSLGLGFFLSLLAAKILRARAVVSVAINLATGFFIPLFYTLNIITGKLFTGFKLSQQEVKGELGESIERSVHNFENIIDEPARYFLTDKIQSISIDFIIGSIINAFLAAILVYIVLWVILARRQKIREQKNKINKRIHAIGIKGNS